MEVDGEDLNNALYIFSKKLFKNPTLHNVKTYFQLLKTKIYLIKAVVNFHVFDLSLLYSFSPP